MMGMQANESHHATTTEHASQPQAAHATQQRAAITAEGPAPAPVRNRTQILRFTRLTPKTPNQGRANQSKLDLVHGLNDQTTSD